MDATGLGATLAVVTAAGTAVTVLTEVAKQYIPEQGTPPPLIAAMIAAVFTAAWEMSQPIPPTLADSFAVLMIWFSLFQVSIAVYHGAQLSAGRRGEKAANVARARERRAARVPSTVHPGPAGVQSRRLNLRSRQSEPAGPPIPDLPINDGDRRAPPPPPPSTDLNAAVRV